MVGEAPVVRRLPGEALGAAGVVLAASALAGAAWQFAPGQPVWRALTGQLVHWSFPMALANAVTLAVAGATLEIRSSATWRRAALLGAAFSAAWISLGADVPYRGASGIATALCAALAIDLARSGGTRTRLLVLAGAVLFVAKVAWEASGHAAPVAAWTLPGGIRVAWPVHVAGALAGIVASLDLRRWKSAVAAAAVCMLVLPAHASGCPNVVLETAKRVAGGRVSKCSHPPGNDAPYTLRVSTEDGRADVVVSPDGTWLRTEREIAFSDLPTPVLRTFAGTEAGAAIDRIVRIEPADGGVFYRVHFRRDRERGEIEIGEDGSVKSR